MRLGNVTYVQKSASTYEQDLANALASGTGPDLFIMPGNEALYVAVRNSARPLGLAFNVGMRLPAPNLPPVQPVLTSQQSTWWRPTMSRRRSP